MTNLQNKIIKEYKIIKEISNDLHIFEISRSEYGKLSQTITLLVDKKYISKHFADNKLYYRKNSTFDHFLDQYLAEISEPATDKDYALINKIKQFIQEGQSLPEENINIGVRLQCFDPAFIKWLSKIKIFNETMLKKHPLYNTINTICFQKMNTGFDEMMGVLQGLYEELSGGNMENQEYLQKIINEIDNLINIRSGIESVEFKTWKRRTEKFLINLFGEDSPELISFQGKRWGLMAFGANMNIDNEKYKIYRNNLESIRTTFQSYMDDAIEKDNASMQITNKDAKAITYAETEVKKMANNKVFIVHGHDNEAKTEVARFIENLALEAIILHEQVDGGKTIIEKIESYTDVGFGIVLYTPCDVGGKDKQTLTQRARQNVVFEHGYLMAKLGRNRVCALVKAPVEFPSDISGVIYKSMDKDGAWKYSISKEMQSVGFHIDMNKIK